MKEQIECEKDHFDKSDWIFYIFLFLMGLINGIVWF